MMTCERCRNVSGQGEKGDSWICEDCRMKPDADYPDRWDAGTDTAVRSGQTERRST